MKENKRRLERRAQLVARAMRGEGITRAQRRTIPERPEEWPAYLARILSKVSELRMRLLEQEETEIDERWQAREEEEPLARESQEVVPMEREEETGERGAGIDTDSTDEVEETEEEDEGEELLFDLWRGHSGINRSHPILITN